MFSNSEFLKIIIVWVLTDFSNLIRSNSIVKLNFEFLAQSFAGLQHNIEPLISDKYPLDRIEWLKGVTWTLESLVFGTLFQLK